MTKTLTQTLKELNNPEFLSCDHSQLWELETLCMCLSSPMQKQSNQATGQPRGHTPSAPPSRNLHKAERCFTSTWGLTWTADQRLPMRYSDSVATPRKPGLKMKSYLSVSLEDCMPPQGCAFLSTMGKVTFKLIPGWMWGKQLNSLNWQQPPSYAYIQIDVKTIS